jgi:SAM-dependent methyltransferase
MTAVAVPVPQAARGVALPPGGAIRWVADALAGQAVIGDLYHEGAATYEALIEHHDNEMRFMVMRSRGLHGDVLDLGCGGGRTALPFLSRGHRVVATDLSADMLAQLAARAADLPRRMADNLEMYQCDMSTVSFPSRTFEIITLGATTITLLDPGARARTFQAVRRHLAPGGRFLISTVWFERSPEQGPPPETAAVMPMVDGKTGATTLVTLMEQVAEDLSYRWVGVLVTGPVGEPLRPRLFVTRPGQLAEATLRAELEAAGLRVVHSDRLSSAPDGRRSSLLTCEEGGMGRGAERSANLPPVFEGRAS